MTTFYNITNKSVAQLVQDSVLSACELYNDDVRFDNGLVDANIMKRFDEIKRLSVCNYNIMLSGDDETIQPENTPTLIIQAINNFVNDKVMLKNDYTAFVVDL